MMTKSEKFYWTWKEDKFIRQLAAHCLIRQRWHKGDAGAMMYEELVAMDFRPKTITKKACEMLCGAHYALRQALGRRMNPPQQRPGYYYVQNGRLQQQPAFVYED